MRLDALELLGSRVPFKAASRFGHPLFGVAVLALALNDHVLKGAGLLPGAVTGKLSDLAGLLVAPLVLAWLTRVKTERGFAWAHLAVGAGFSLLQVSAVAELVNTLPVPVQVWADPTDLLALPALVVSWLAFRRWEGRPHRAVGVVALVFCTATSQNSPPPRYPFPPAGVLETDVYLRHRGGDDIQISLRGLNEDHQVDCAALLDDPELEDGAFGEAQEWTLADGDAVPLWERRGGSRDRDCYAVLLQAQSRSWLVTWRHDAPPVREIDIRLEPDVEVEPEAVRLRGEDPPRVPSGVHVELRP